MHSLKIAMIGTFEVAFQTTGTLPNILSAAEAEGYAVPAYSTVANAINKKDYYLTDIVGVKEEDANCVYIFVVVAS